MFIDTKVAAAIMAFGVINANAAIAVEKVDANKNGALIARNDPMTVTVTVTVCDVKPTPSSVSTSVTEVTSGSSVSVTHTGSIPPVTESTITKVTPSTTGVKSSTASHTTKHSTGGTGTATTVTPPVPTSGAVHAKFGIVAVVGAVIMTIINLV
ncbi:hypothetical protein PRK78_000609 [Emydomyces testavorans]|uniref:Uncharacterized protein n=1 Tax=Emydomyces testavorans TaxID=2070801 RepID=A0AAF0IEM1_9EURO|nr:hypothetical protein PRK78_000609 [Emydomyces testavorans]